MFYPPKKVSVDFLDGITFGLEVSVFRNSKNLRPRKGGAKVMSTNPIYVLDGQIVYVVFPSVFEADTQESWFNPDQWERVKYQHNDPESERGNAFRSSYELVGFPPFQFFSMPNE